MGSYVPGTKEEQLALLKEAGYESFEALYTDVPESVYLKNGIEGDWEGMSELEVSRYLQCLSEQNKRYRAIFRGAGAYHHYIPSIVGRVVRKETFLTAYTPYQAEISQGVLQSIFEFQSMIMALTGLDVANASVYDGATAAAEAVELCVDKKHPRVLISGALAPEVISVVKTYCFGKNTPCEVVAVKDGKTDVEDLKNKLAAQDEEGKTVGTACFLMAVPNYHGLIEPAEEIGQLVHEAGAKFVLSVNPISLGLLKTPAELGADVAVGEGQPLGMPLSFGGPYVGFMAATKDMMRKLPGRMVGETVDSEGRRAFVLTLQAREQHIKREKASSNICSNQALCALTAAVYLSAVGPDGLKEVAAQCASKAHYLQKGLAEAGFARANEGEFFHEFVTVSEHSDALLQALEERGILGGLKLSDREILWCCTELNTRADMDEVISLAKEVSVE